MKEGRKMTNEEIQVGEYVRTNDGLIFKVVKINGEAIYRFYKDKNNFSYCLQEDIVKHSFNLIDLIEVGDYVNGEKTIQISKTYGLLYTNITFYNEDEELVHKYYQEKDIDTIVTKEQFKSMEYEVGGDNECS